MRVVIAGGHGQIALLLEQQLATRGDAATALVRNPDHFADVQEAGAVPVLCDLESAELDSVAEYLNGADAAVFAAGAGPGSGPARKDTVDHGAAALFAAAAVQAGVRRFVQVSTVGIEAADSPDVDPSFAVYLKAKKRAEEDLRERDLDWTILRPGPLVNDPATGLVTLAEPRLPRASVTRADVAAVLAELLGARNTAGKTLELVNGETPVADAVRAIL
ncbi:Putative NADH-flavin reductase [Lentzea xinjiangensis]|uniref:Putative NADH-flavin reductase n=1 Tax=Lentzea xinjiangensis TaxID=402600 RepID=A0A1H8ZVL8_9PSEU|nr:NAD(P)H-binding protein [Lentzea xinjiangensis]SEP67798.1 Putative NADH-flavin reductase [Lentzea xinjiangensis]